MSETPDTDSDTDADDTGAATDELAALREQTTHGDRLDEAAHNEISAEFIETLVSELDAIDAGETQKTVSVWDGSFAAFLRALEAHPEQLDAVGADLQAELDGSADDSVDRSEVIRLALRVGLKEASPETFAALQEGVQRHAVNQL